MRPPAQPPPIVDVVKQAGIRTFALLALAWPAACGRRVEPFSVAYVDRSVSGLSHFPVAVAPERVGSYPGPAKSGAGYFYDDVLEYRVWLHPERGAEALAGDNDYFAAFAQYEPALAFSRSHRGAEPPVALVRQREWVNEPSPGRYVWVRTERVTEWQPRWLAATHREPGSIPRFLAAHASAQK